MEPYFWPMLLLILGIVLVFLEVFVPSGGILGLLAGCSVLASIVVAFSDGLVTGTVVLAVAILVVPLVVVSAVKWWPHTPLGKLVLAKRPESEDEVLPDTEEYHREEMIGTTGVAKSDLLPSGDVQIDGRIYDAVSAGMAIGRGEPVKVVAVEIQRLVVRPLAQSETDSTERHGSDDVLSTPIDSLGIEPFEDPLA